MEEEIQEALENIYNIPIKVKWKDFRIYEIEIKISNHLINISIVYDTQSTKDYNISNIVQKIDKEIPKIFKKEGK